MKTVNAETRAVLPAALVAWLEDVYLCAAEIQDLERIIVGPLSLLVCLTCGRAATRTRAETADTASNHAGKHRPARTV